MRRIKLIAVDRIARFKFSFVVCHPIGKGMRKYAGVIALDRTALRIVIAALIIRVQRQIAPCVDFFLRCHSRRDDLLCISACRKRPGIIRPVSSAQRIVGRICSAGRRNDEPEFIIHQVDQCFPVLQRGHV